MLISYTVFDKLPNQNYITIFKYVIQNLMYSHVRHESSKRIKHLSLNITQLPLPIQPAPDVSFSGACVVTQNESMSYQTNMFLMYPGQCQQGILMLRWLLIGWSPLLGYVVFPTAWGKYIDYQIPLLTHDGKWPLMEIDGNRTMASFI